MEFIFGKNPIKTLRRVFLIIFTFYFSFGALLLFVQRDLIYFPTQQPLSNCDLLESSTKYLQIGSEQALYHQGDSDRLIVMYHGNADSACLWQNLVYDFSFAGESVLIPEWPGYAGDQRATTQENMFSMVNAVDQWINEQDYQEILVVSYSIGGAPAAHHVSLGNVDRLLMFAPFDELIRVVWDKYMYYPPMMLYDNYDNLSLLRQSRIPIWIMHGQQDQVVSPRRSERLVQELDSPRVSYTVVPNKGHQDLLSGQSYDDLIDQFLLESDHE